MLSLRDIRAAKRKREKDQSISRGNESLDIPRNIELKTREWKRKIGMTLTNNAVLNRPHYSNAFYTSIPISALVARGTSRNQRVGNMITIHKLKINVGVVYKCFDPINNIDPNDWAEFQVPGDVKVWLVRKKQAHVVNPGETIVPFDDILSRPWHQLHTGVYVIDQIGPNPHGAVDYPGQKWSNIANTCISPSEPNVEILKTWMIKPNARGYSTNLSVEYVHDIDVTYKSNYATYGPHLSQSAPEPVDNNQNDGNNPPVNVLSFYQDNEDTCVPSDVVSNELWLFYTTDMKASTDGNTQSNGLFTLDTSVKVYFTDL